MDQEKTVIKVGKKDKSKYLDAVFYQLDKWSSCTLRGLGHRQRKVLELRLEVEDIDGVEAEEVKSIEVNGTPGIEVHLRRGGGGLG